MHPMKKKGKKMSEAHVAAKKNVLSSLRDQAAEAMGDKLKKVTVAAPSEEGLKKGLEKAKEIVEGKLPDENCPHDKMMANENSEMDSGDSEDESEEQEEMSLDEVNAKLEELMKMKKQLEEQKV